MIENPTALAAVLIGVVSLIVGVSKTAAGGRLFKVLPVPFYCYFLPILGATAGLFPAESPVYSFFSKHILPACLVLLLVGSPWNELFRLGRQAVLAIGIGAVGMFLGAVIAYTFFHTRLPPDSWMAAGALLGSWTGGSANMMAVKETLAMPDALLAPLIIVDTILAYGWMALLIALAGAQAKFDAFFGADRRVLELVQSSGTGGGICSTSWTARIVMILAAVAAGEAALYAGGYASKAAPGLGLSGLSWAILIATAAGLALSLTPARKLEEAGASKAGTTVLLLLLTSYGARTDLRAILSAPAFMAFGAVMLAVHGIILFSLGRVFRLPLFYLATASQACLGGPVSAPIVAGVYHPSLTHVGVILALFGGAVGTYVGLLGAMLCRWIGV